MILESGGGNRGQVPEEVCRLALPSAHLLLDEAIDLPLHRRIAVVAVDVGQRVNESPPQASERATPPDSRRRRPAPTRLLLTAGVGCPGSTSGDDTLPAARAPTACSVCGGSRGSGLGGFQSPLPHNRIQNPVLDFFYLPFQNFLFWHPGRSISTPFDFDSSLLID